MHVPSSSISDELWAARIALLTLEAGLSGRHSEAVRFSFSPGPEGILAEEAHSTLSSLPEPILCHPESVGNMLHIHWEHLSSPALLEVHEIMAAKTRCMWAAKVQEDCTFELPDCPLLMRGPGKDLLVPFRGFERWIGEYRIPCSIAGEHPDAVSQSLSPSTLIVCGPPGQVRYDGPLTPIGSPQWSDMIDKLKDEEIGGPDSDPQSRR
jgi:hypothetical protein